MAFTPSKLIEAIRAGKLTEVIRALDGGADIEEADVHGFRGLPLRTACFSGDLTIVQELLRRGANVNAATSDGPGAPLRMALRGGHPEIAELLMQDGPHVAPVTPPEPAIISKPADLFEPMAYEVVAVAAPPAPIAAPPASKSSSMDELSSFLANQPIEEVDISSCYGVDTNVLNMDLMRYNEEHAELPPPPEPTPSEPEVKKPSFWKIGRPG